VTCGVGKHTDALDFVAQLLQLRLEALRLQGRQLRLRRQHPQRSEEVAQDLFRLSSAGADQITSTEQITLQWLSTRRGHCCRVGEVLRSARMDTRRACARGRGSCACRRLERVAHRRGLIGCLHTCVHMHMHIPASIVSIGVLSFTCCAFALLAEPRHAGRVHARDRDRPCTDTPRVRWQGLSPELVRAAHLHLV